MFASITPWSVMMKYSLINVVNFIWSARKKSHWKPLKQYNKWIWAETVPFYFWPEFLAQFRPIHCFNSICLATKEKKGARKTKQRQIVIIMTCFTQVFGNASVLMMLATLLINYFSHIFALLASGFRFVYAVLRVLLGVNFFMSPRIRSKNNNNFLTVLCFNYRNETMDALLLLNPIISDVNQTEAHKCVVFRIMILENSAGLCHQMPLYRTIFILSDLLK